MLKLRRCRFSCICRSYSLVNQRSIRVDVKNDDRKLPARWNQIVSPGDVKVLAKCRSLFNCIQVLEIARHANTPLAGARVLLLDEPCNIHSLHYRFKISTGSYYDILASLPPLLPEGPIGIYGLGAGTVARMIHHFWPHIDLHGWELDPVVVDVGRKFFDLSELETGKDSLEGIEEGCVADNNTLDYLLRTSSYNSGLTGKKYSENVPLHHTRDDNTIHVGKLSVHVEDALSEKAALEGRFSGLIVDIFANGTVVPALQYPETWKILRQRLKPGGRIMVNCGGSCVESELKKDGLVTAEETFSALEMGFSGEVVKRFVSHNSGNIVALAGAMPDYNAWKKGLPNCLRQGVFGYG